NSSLNGHEVTTIEGLGTKEKPHPIQKAFIEEQAVQCAYCISGIMLYGKDFVDRNPNATEQEILDGLKAQQLLCRCYTHLRMVRAPASLRPGGAAMIRRSQADGREPMMTADALAALERAGFSRRDFWKGTGALIVTFSMSGPSESAPAADGLLGGTGNPPTDWVDSWIAIAADETVTAYSGKCEFGQGFRTVQYQLVADELYVP